MNELIEVQVIEQNGKPAFAVMPWDEYERIRPLLERDKAARGIPQEVVERHVLEDIPLVRAWREYMGISQSDLATKANMAQPALSRIERAEVTPRRDTLVTLAKALGLAVEQLEE